MQACNYQEHPARGVPEFLNQEMRKKEIFLIVIVIVIVAVLSYLFYMYGICEAKQTTRILNSPA